MPFTVDVLIAGAGPTGLMLAGELAERGIRVAVADRATRIDDAPKGNGIVGHAAVQLRRLGLLDGTGLKVVRPPQFPFGPLRLRLGLGPSNPLHVLAIPQHRLEQLLQERAAARGVRILRGHKVNAFAAADDMVTVHLHTPNGDEQATTAFLVGCDGARSIVRSQAGIGFPGFTSDQIARIARVTIPDVAVAHVGDEIELLGIGRFAAFGPNRAPGGDFSITPAAALDPAAPGDLYIVATQEPLGSAPSDDALSTAELSASLARVLGTKLPFSAATALRATVGNSRQVDAYRRGRVLLAGDAAHIFNAGGSAINAGLLDALDLAPRLASTITGSATLSELDQYDTSRRSACERVLAHTRLQASLRSDDESGAALRTVLTPVLRSRTASRALARLIEGAPARPASHTGT